MSWRPLVEALPVMARGHDEAMAMGARANGLTAHGTIDPSAAPQASVEASLRASEQGHARTEPLAPGAPTLEEAPFGNSVALAEAAEQMRLQAKEQGYEQGAALARAEQEGLQLRYRAAIEELIVAREQTIEACEADLVRLALIIAREVLMSDVQGRQQFAAEMARHALQLLGGQAPVILRLHSQDAAALRTNKPELVARSDVQLIEDDTLEVGDVLAEGGHGRLDASIEGRLAAMRSQLLHDDAAARP